MCTNQTKGFGLFGEFFFCLFFGVSNVIHQYQRAPKTQICELTLENVRPDRFRSLWLILDLPLKIVFSLERGKGKLIIYSYIVRFNSCLNWTDQDKS